MLNIISFENSLVTTKMLLKLKNESFKYAKQATKSIFRVYFFLKTNLSAKFML
jgi:hypothetical protein